MIGGSVVSRLCGITLSAETPFTLHWSPLNDLLFFFFIYTRFFCPSPLRQPKPPCAATAAATCFASDPSAPPHHRDPGACSQHCFLLLMAF